MFDVRFVIDDWIGLIKTNTQSWSTTTPISQSISQHWFVTLNQSINENVESGMESNGK